MNNDLFTEVKPKKLQLYEFIKMKGRVPTSGIIQWGLTNYHTRSERDARDLATEGRIWRMSDRIKMCSQWRSSKEDIWSVHPSDKE